MVEYIEREALLEKFQFRIPVTSEAAKTYKECADLARKLITEATAADVVEVRHGEWMDNGYRDSRGAPKPFATSCSVCGSSAGSSWMRYCPNCGAKMDGKGDRE